MHNGGFVNQAYRDMLKWQWYHDNVVRSLFEHLLRIVNENDKMELGICIKSGSVLITINEIAYTIGFTVKQIRGAMDKLISSHDISIKSIHAKGTIITIEKWHKYQLKINDNLTDGNRRATEGQQQVIDNNNLTEMKAFQRATEGQQNTETAIQNQPNGNRRATEGQQQNADIQEDTNVIEIKRATEGQQQDQPKEKENKEISPTPLKEKEEKEKIEKEKYSKKEKAESETDDGNAPQQQMLPGIEEAVIKPPRERIAFKDKKLVGIIDEDKKKWKHDFPYLDTDAILADAEAYLARHPKKYDDIYRFINNSFKRQPYPFPNTADDVLQMANERKLTLAKEAAEYFFNKFQAIGWMDKGKPIHDWRCLLDNFAKNPWANRNNTLGGNNSGNTGEQPERLSNGEWNNKYVSKFGDANWADQQNEGKW